MVGVCWWFGTCSLQPSCPPTLRLQTIIGKINKGIRVTNSNPRWTLQSTEKINSGIRVINYIFWVELYIQLGRSKVALDKIVKASKQSQSPPAKKHPSCITSVHIIVVMLSKPMGLWKAWRFMQRNTLQWFSDTTELRIEGPLIANLTTKAHGLLHSGDSGPGVPVRCCLERLQYHMKEVPKDTKEGKLLNKGNNGKTVCSQNCNGN